MKRSSIQGRGGRRPCSVPGSARTRSGTRSAERGSWLSEVRGGVRSVTPSSRSQSLSRPSAVPRSAAPPTRTGSGRNAVVPKSQPRSVYASAAGTPYPLIATGLRSTAQRCASSVPTAQSGVSDHPTTCGSTCMASPRRISNACWSSRTTGALSAERPSGVVQAAGLGNLMWTTTMRRAESGDCCAGVATTASVPSGTTLSDCTRRSNICLASEQGWR